MKETHRCWVCSGMTIVEKRKVLMQDDKTKDVYRVLCMSCGHAGPWEDKRADAINDYNEKRWTK